MDYAASDQRVDDPVRTGPIAQAQLVDARTDRRHRARERHRQGEPGVEARQCIRQVGANLGRQSQYISPTGPDDDDHAADGLTYETWRPARDLGTLPAPPGIPTPLAPRGAINYDAVRVSTHPVDISSGQEAQARASQKA